MTTPNHNIALADEELPGYFEEHSKTDRHMFHRDHVRRLWELAGMPAPRNARPFFGEKSTPESDFIAMPYSPRLQAIIDIVRERFQEAKEEEALAWDGPLY